MMLSHEHINNLLAGEFERGKRHGRAELEASTKASLNDTATIAATHDARVRDAEAEYYAMICDGVEKSEVMSKHFNSVSCYAARNAAAKCAAKIRALKGAK